MKRATLPISALILIFAAGAFAASNRRKATVPGYSGATDGEGLESAEPMDLSQGVNKKRFEAYLKERLGKINGQHQARVEFMNSESETWMSFWNKIRDDRRLFEIRMTRQTLNLFESLASLDSRDHPTTISDFEKMQANVVRSFETQQKQKMDEFFAARDTRWRTFITQQEEERAQFLANAAADWQQSKQGLRRPALVTGTSEDLEDLPPPPANPAPAPSRSKPRSSKMLPPGWQ